MRGRRRRRRTRTTRLKKEEIEEEKKCLKLVRFNRVSGSGEIILKRTGKE